MTNLDFETILDPSREVLESLWRGLEGLNRSVLGGYDYARLAVVVRNEDGDVIGGLCGDLLLTTSIWRPPAFRRWIST